MPDDWHKQVLILSNENLQMRLLIKDALWLAEGKGWNDVVAKLRQALDVGDELFQYSPEDAQ